RCARSRPVLVIVQLHSERRLDSSDGRPPVSSTSRSPDVRWRSFVPRSSRLAPGQATTNPGRRRGFSGSGGRMIEAQRE
ncbi:MAG: hypothetical protein WA696_15710, partial [Solirubrobacterales bacterium]